MFFFVNISFMITIICTCSYCFFSEKIFVQIIFRNVYFSNALLNDPSDRPIHNKNMTLDVCLLGTFVLSKYITNCKRRIAKIKIKEGKGFRDGFWLCYPTSSLRLNPSRSSGHVRICMHPQDIATRIGDNYWDCISKGIR